MRERKREIRRRRKRRETRLKLRRKASVPKAKGNKPKASLSEKTRKK
ncbi:MAG TPA: hypothetical protein VII00_09410 [bacterium]